MYTYKYPHPAVTADSVVICFDEGRLQLLLIRRGAEPCKDCWALPGGFMNIDETADECARRELQEETGLTLTRLEQLAAFTAVGRDPRERVLTIAFCALVRKEGVEGGDDASDARWFALNNLPPLAFDHADIVQKALGWLREKVFFAPVVFDLLPHTFTLNEALQVYERILGAKLNGPRLFQQMAAAGLLVVAETTGQGGAEPADCLYTFNAEAYERGRQAGSALWPCPMPEPCAKP